jgi:hypothetical protein
MKQTLFLFMLLIQSGSIFSQDNELLSSDRLMFYIDLNNKESRLIEYKDNDESLRMKLIQLDIINKSRKKFRLSPVMLDILASRVANMMCKEAAENGYISHWNLAGEKPYHRYAFAGGYDHVSENAYGTWTSGIIENSPSEISKMMKEGHLGFMAEKAPNDGHKQNIIGKNHNWVGIGYFITVNQFRYYEEFIDRYFEFENIPFVLRTGEAGSITLKTDGSIFPYYLVIYHEKFLARMSVAQLKNTGSYQDFTKEISLEMPAWEIGKFRNGNKYRIPLKFNREGLYYIHIFFDKKEIKNPSALSTKGKPEGCGIVIRVEK